MVPFYFFFLFPLFNVHSSLHIIECRAWFAFRLAYGKTLEWQRFKVKYLVAGDDMMSENATPMNYDSRMDEEIDRIVQLIINRYNNQQSSLIKRGGYIRLV